MEFNKFVGTMLITLLIMFILMHLFGELTLCYGLDDFIKGVSTKIGGYC